jgi:hypothetical protein
MLYVYLCVFPFELLKRVTDFREISLEGYAIGGQPNDVLPNFRQSVIIAWRPRELVRLERH